MTLSPGQGHHKVRSPDGVRKTQESTDLVCNSGPVVVPEQQRCGVGPVACVAIDQVGGGRAGDRRANGGPQGVREPGDDR